MIIHVYETESRDGTDDTGMNGARGRCIRGLYHSGTQTERNISKGRKITEQKGHTGCGHFFSAQFPVITRIFPTKFGCFVWGRRAHELRRRLGLSPWQELEQDVRDGWRRIKGSPVYHKVKVNISLFPLRT
jgi:hypothetical protein